MTTWHGTDGNGWNSAYNSADDGVDPFEEGTMERTVTTIRCVPRYGYDFTNVREVELDLPTADHEHALHQALSRWFAERSIADAVYDIDVDDDGFFAIINDETYYEEWGAPLL